MWGWLILGAFTVSFLGILGWRLIVGRRRYGYLAMCEYWVYVTQPQLPSQEKLMTRMISDNPHNRPGRACIGAREGMLFTDIRTHIAVVKREKNPHLFRPDLFHSEINVTAEILQRLAEASGFIKVRYVSEVELRDTRHLQFLPHMADTASELCGGLVVYDPVMEEVWTAEDFRARLASNNNAERPDFHGRVVWEKTDSGCSAATKGLVKVGIHEWRTGPVECDQEVLIVGLLNRVMQKLMRNPKDPGPYSFDEYGDEFTLTPTGQFKDGEQIISITRKVQS